MNPAMNRTLFCISMLKPLPDSLGFQYQPLSGRPAVAFTAISSNIDPTAPRSAEIIDFMKCLPRKSLLCLQKRDNWMRRIAGLQEPGHTPEAREIVRPL